MARLPGFIAVLVLMQVPVTAARAQEDGKAAAREHFEKGVAAFNEKRFAEAATEFEAAYRLSPAAVVLYNIGQVDVALGRAVEAVDAFEKYLADGGTSIPPDRQAEVRAEIEKQRAQIGTLAVTTSPPGAAIRIDGRLIGKAPLISVRLTAGKHTIEAQLGRYLSQARDVDVVGRLREEVVFTLKPVLVIVPEASLPPVEPVAPVQTGNEVVTRQPDLASETPNRMMRTAGYAVGGLGLVAVVTGGIIAVQSTVSASDAKSRAMTAVEAAPTAADQMAFYQAKSDFDSAKSHNELGWVIGGIGAGALVAGLVMLKLVPDRTSHEVALTVFSPSVCGREGGLALEGSW